MNHQDIGFRHISERFTADVAHESMTDDPGVAGPVPPKPGQSDGDLVPLVMPESLAQVRCVRLLAQCYRWEGMLHTPASLRRLCGF